MTNRLHYRIAEQSVEIYTNFLEKISKMLYGFGNFSGTYDNSVPFLQLVLESDSRDITESAKDGDSTIIHTFNLEEDNCIFSKKGNRYIFTIEDNHEVITLQLLMEIGSPIVRFILNPKHSKNHNNLPDPNQLKFSLWIAIAFVGIPNKLAAVHSSVIVLNSRAIMFLGESGCGKSTHTKLWLKHISGSTLLNDDSPILSIEEDKPYVYGSPWSGKGKCYINEKYPVEAFVRLKQHPSNKIIRLNKLESFGALYPSFPPAFLKDEYFQEHICTIISKVITTTPVYLLHCLPNQEAAEMVWEKIFGEKKF